MTATDVRKLRRTLIRRACTVLVCATEPRPLALSLLLTDDEPTRELNRRWRGEDHATDVLSFPAPDRGPAAPPDEPRPLGDVVLNLAAIARQAPEEMPQRLVRLGLRLEAGARWGTLEEATFLLIHGILHLLGHDHHEPGAEAAMVAEEARLMAPFLRGRWRRSA